MGLLISLAVTITIISAIVYVLKLELEKLG